MVEVICDTNFLIHLATRRIKNIDNLDVEIGQITFVVPEVVKNELSKLAKSPKKILKNHLNEVEVRFCENFIAIQHRQSSSS